MAEITQKKVAMKLMRNVSVEVKDDVLIFTYKNDCIVNSPIDLARFETKEDMGWLQLKTNGRLGIQRNT